MNLCERYIINISSFNLLIIDVVRNLLMLIYIIFFVPELTEVPIKRKKTAKTKTDRESKHILCQIVRNPAELGFQMFAAMKHRPTVLPTSSGRHAVFFFFFSFLGKCCQPRASPLFPVRLPFQRPLRCDLCPSFSPPPTPSDPPTAGSPSPPTSSSTFSRPLSPCLDQNAADAKKARSDFLQYQLLPCLSRFAFAYCLTWQLLKTSKKRSYLATSKHL